MKLHNEPQNKARMSDGVKGTSEFKIRSSAKAFGILSSSLYSDPIKAIVRELSCNAYDSHVAAGKSDVPIDIHIPTKFNNEFSVKDYGLGLDHEEVTEIYTTYFESTKTDSNEFIGALGLGSKTPFSYTQNFSVTAIKDGVKRVYVSYVSDEGMPSIALLHEMETNEANGVEVSFAIANEDVHKFVHACYEVFQYFPVKPNFTGRSFEIPKVEYVFNSTFENIRVYKRSNKNPHAHNKNNLAIMGNIAYPIKPPSSHHIHHSESLDIYFDLGELDIQPSREGLHYTEKTIQLIEKKYSQYADEIEKQIKKKIEENKNNVWKQAKELLNEFADRDKHRRVAFNNATKDLENPFYDQRLGFVDVKLENKDHYAQYNCEIISFYIRNGTVKSKYDHVFGVNTTTIFIINEKNKKVLSNLKKYFKGGNTTANVHIIQKINKNNELDLEKVMNAFYNPPREGKYKNVYDISEYDLTPFKATYQKKENPNNILQFTESYRNFEDKLQSFPIKTKENVDEIDFGEDVTKIYFPMKGAKIIDNKGNANLREYYNNFYFSAKMKGFINKVVLIGVRNEQIEIAKQSKDLITLEEYVMNQLNNINVNDFIFSGDYSHTSLRLRSLRNFIESDQFKNLSKDSYFKQIMEMYDINKSKKLQLNNLENFVKRYFDDKYFDKISSKYNEAIKIHNKFEKNYPLLKYIDTISKDSHFFNSLKEYIEMQDNQQPKEIENAA